MATELGQAYVQIIPSAKGIKGSIEKDLGGEATSAGKSAGGTIASTIKKVIAVAAIGKAIGAALMAGGELQQSLGGVETLFKENADKVKQYANEAYKTAGISANDYMESVTSFSASLLQSMGGDTKAAADKANMALVGMSDNANKMGTSMESIQTAYQGFAKQNYTMLDNLKLGYGGTKTEMERLLADATKLTGVKYDINNLADVYDAIHAVQTELGITGTTALESAETLKGSFASMKGAAANFLGNLSLGEDVGPSLQALAETVSTFLFGNFLPMIGNILKALPESIITFVQAATPYFLEAGTGFISQLVIGITTGLPSLLEKGKEIISNIVNGILEAIPLIIESAGNIITTFIGFVLENLPKILETGKDLLSNLVSGIINNLPAIITSAIEAVGKFIDTIIEHLPGVIAAGVKLLVEFVGGIISNLPDLIAAAITLIAKFAAMIISKLPDIIAAGKAILSSIVSGIGQVASNLYDKGTELMTGVINKIKEKLTDFYNAGKDIVEGLWNGITDKAAWLKEKISGFIEGIKNVFTGKEGFDMHSPSKLSEAWGLNIVGGIANGVINNAHLALDAIKSLVEKMTSTARSAVDSTFDILTTAQMGQMTSDLKTLTDVEKKKKEKSLRAELGDKKYNDLYGQGVDSNGLMTNSQVGVRELILESMSNFAKQGGDINKWQDTEHGQFWTDDKYTNRYDLKDNEFDAMKNQATITQNITINSPTALSPSVIAKETKKAAQNAVLPLLR